MLYKELCEVYENLEKNPSRLKKTEILSEFLKKLRHEKNKAIIFFLGSNIDTDQMKFLIGETKAKYGFNILDMYFTKEQYEQGISHGIYPEMKKNLFFQKPCALILTQLR